MAPVLGVFSALLVLVLVLLLVLGFLTRPTAERCDESTSTSRSTSTAEVEP